MLQQPVLQYYGSYLQCDQLFFKWPQPTVSAGTASLMSALSCAQTEGGSHSTPFSPSEMDEQKSICKSQEITGRM